MRFGESHHHFDYTMIETEGHTIILEETQEKDMGIWNENKLSFKDGITTATLKTTKIVSLVCGSFT